VAFLKTKKNSSGFTPRSWKKKNTVVLIVGSTNVDKFDGGSTEKMLKTMTWLLSRQSMTQCTHGKIEST
jgi:hypothetical protein